MAGIGTRLESAVRTMAASLEPGAPLPTDVEIAREWKISLRTTGRVMRELAAQGVVERIQGSGTFVAGGKPAEMPVRSRPDSAGSLFETLRESINRGEFKEGEGLPSVKFLCHRFRVSASTVTAAYEKLRVGGLAHKIGRRFWVGPFVSLDSASLHKEVYLFTKTKDEFRDVLRGDSLSRSYLTMHRELARHGFVVLYETIGTMDEKLGQWEKDNRFPYALAFFRMYQDSYAAISDAVKTACTGAYRIQRTAINVFVDQRPVLENVSLKYTVLNRSSLTTMVARKLAEFIRQKSCRHVRFFWDTLEPFNQSGYSWSSFWHILKIPGELKEMSPGTGFSFCIYSPTSGVTPVHIVDKYIAALGPQTAQRILSSYHLTREEILAQISIVTDFQHAFSLQRGRAREAWVFTTDEEAGKAIEWARGRSLKIPGDIAIIGLQNNPDYFPYNITTIEPDWETIGYLMAHALIGDITLAKTTRGYMRLPAIVYEGLTT